MVDLPSLVLDKYTTEEPSGGGGAQAIASAFGQLGATLDKAGETLAAANLDAAAAEGENSVSRDANGELKVTFRDSTSRRDIAYNRAARQAYVARLSGEIRVRGAELRAESNGDLTAFETSYKSFGDQLTGKQDPMVQGAVRTLIDGEFNAQREGLINERRTLDLKAYEGGIVAEIKALDDEMAAIAHGGGVGTAEYGRRQSSVKDLYQELVQNPAFKMSEVEAGKKIERMVSRHSAEAAVGKVEATYREQGLEAANNEADELFYDKDLLLTDEERRVYSGIAKSRISGINAERRAELVPVQEEAKALREGINNGGTYDDEDVDQVIGNLARLGDVAGSFRLMRDRARAKALKDYSLLPDEAQANMLQEALAGHATNIVDRIVTAESGGRSNARNPRSTATGAGQFIDATWLDVVKRYRPDVAEGKTDRQILSLRGDSELSKEMVQRYGEQNALALKDRGLPTTDGTLYLAHFLGPEGAGDVLYSAADTPIGKVLSKEVLDANPFLKGMTAGQLVKWADRKMGTGSMVDGKVLAGMRKEVASDAKRYLDHIKEGVKKGVAPGSENLERLRRSVELLGDEDLTADLNASAQEAGILSQFAQVPPVAQQRAIDEAQGMPSDINGIDVVDAMRLIHNRTVEGLDKDPIGLAIERGISKPLEALDFADPQKLTQGLQLREQQAQVVGAYYGRQDVLPLRPEEVTAMAGVLANAPPAQQATIFGTLRSGLSPQSYKATIGALAQKSDARLVASAGAIYLENPDVAVGVLRGAALLKENSRLAPKEDIAYGDQLDRLLPSQAFAPAMEASRQDVVNAARALYADLSNQANDTSGLINGARLETAVNAVAGGIVDMNGAKAIVPLPGMTQDQFDGVMSRLTSSDLTLARVGEQQVSADDVRKWGQLKAVGAGKYLIAYGEDENAQFMMSLDGRPFVLDLRRAIEGRPDR